MEIECVAVVGCGRMGLGIVECAAAAGLSVIAIKSTPGDITKARARLEKSVGRSVARGKRSQEDAEALLERVEFDSRFDRVAEAALVIESVVEDLPLKRGLLRRLEASMNPRAVLASNTSSLRLFELAAVLERPSRFIGLHFFNPVPAMKLVELATLERTESYAAPLAEAFCARLGKTAVRVEAQPGYVVNRLLVPLLLHAIETLDCGVADASSIDTAMKLGCAHPMGPLALADLIGLDVVMAMADTLRAELRDPRYDAPPLLRALVDAGDLGRKATRGIFDYSGDAPTLNPAIADGTLERIAS
ncbi:MAG: 3-hydroxyacyl-CoA dehydrogenase NAD-binding domain-containing protein [Myxococcota bacterium]